MIAVRLEHSGARQHVMILAGEHVELGLAEAHWNGLSPELQNKHSGSLDRNSYLNQSECSESSQPVSKTSESGARVTIDGEAGVHSNVYLNWKTMCSRLVRS